LLVFSHPSKHFDFHSELRIRRNNIRYSCLAIGEVRSDDNLPVPSHIHSLRCVENSADKIFSVNSDQVPKIAIVFNLEVLVHLVGQAHLWMLNNFTPI